MTTSPIEWCGASTRGFGAVLLGPCVLSRGHDGPLHLDGAGVSWTDPRPASESTDPLCPPALREQLVEAVRKAAHWCDGRCDCTEDDGHELFVSVLTFESHVERVEGTPEAIADAVLPVVEAWAAEQTQRAEQAERRLAYRHGEWQRELDARIAAEQKLQEAERQRDEARDLLREFVDDIPCHLHPGNGSCQTHFERKPCPHAAAKKLLGIDPKETP